MNLTFDHSENALFEFYSEQDISLFLWEMYQCWMLELSQLDKTHQEVSNRQYFFELLAAHIHQAKLKPPQESSGKASPTHMAEDTFQNSG